MRGLEKVPAVYAALVLLMFFLAAFAGIFGYFLVQGVRQTSASLEARSAAAAEVVATNAGWLAEVAHQTLRRVDAALGPTMMDDGTKLDLALEGLPARTEVYVVDASARTIFSTVPGADDVSIADRQYFAAVRDGAPFYVSGLIVSRLTSEQIFVFSKRVERGGVFAGAVMVSFPAEVVERFGATLDFSDGSAVSLVRTDGTLIARFPPTEGPLDLSSLPLFTQYLPASPSGTYTSDSSPVDGVARVVSYRTVESSDIIALASVSSAQTWSGFQGAIIAVFITVSPIIMGLIVGSIWMVRLLFRDATREKELREAVETNVLLFREIHHRVKNNLQSVQSLVRMQDMPAGAKQDMQSRLAAMAAMHEHIYKFDRYVDIDATDFAPAVADEVVRAYGSSARVTYDVDHLMIDRDHASPFALLLSELITNALKYAFVDGREGEILISLKPAGTGRGRLVVADNGVGLAAGLTAGMGTRLVKGVVGQMAGSFTLTSEAGARFEANIALERSGHETQHAKLA